MVDCKVPCIICQKLLVDENGDNNQPVKGLAFTSHGHWPSAIMDGCYPYWLEINICEPCLQAAADRQHVLTGEREGHRGPTTWGFWKFPKRGES
jgi:hypothetical protein